MTERNRTPDNGGEHLPGKLARGACWFFASGVFLILQFMLLRQRELELEVIPIHLALLGLLSALLPAAVTAGVRTVELLAVVIASFLLTMSLTLPGFGGWFLWIGWPILIAAAARKLVWERRAVAEGRPATAAVSEGEVRR